MEFFSLQNPAVQSAIIPLALALISAPAWAALRHDWTGFAVGIGFIAAYVAAIGVPAFPPVSSTQKIPYLIAAGGVLLAVLPAALPWRVSGTVLWSVVSCAYVAWPRLGGDGTLEAIVATALASALLAICLWREQQDVLVMLLVASLGLIPVAFFGSSASIAQASGGLAAATGGLLLWNWPRQRWHHGTAAVVVGIGSFLLLSHQAALFSRTSNAALLLLACSFLVVWLPKGLPARGRATRALALAGLCLIPTALAVLVSWSQQTSSGY